AAVPLWMRLSLIEECRSRARQALATLEAGGSSNLRNEMRLHAALGGSIPEVSEIGAAFSRVLDIADRLGDQDYQLRALRGLHLYHVLTSDYRTALSFAEKFHDLAMSRPNANDRLFAERMVVAANHYLGDTFDARR